MATLIGAVAERLALGVSVAHAKWSSGLAVEDVPRERDVIARASAAGAALGLDEAEVRTFFADQILANKVVQYYALAQWRRLGRAPEGSPPDLATAVRPQLDRIQGVLLEQLAALDALRHAPDCALIVARDSGAYADDKRLDEAARVALDLALARFCSTSH